MQQPHQREHSGLTPPLALLLALGALLVLPCVLLVLFSRWLPRRLSDWRGFWPLVAVIGACCVVGFLLVGHPLRAIPNQLESVLSEAIRQVRSDTWSIPRL